MNMELQCPQCGKWMAVSQEELLMHDSQVVCPQCLAVCRYENGTLVVRDDSDAPYRHTANVDTASNEASKYCHNCGKQLPVGISFCPYCGVDLKAPFSPQQPEPQQPKPAPEKPAVETKPASEPKKESRPQPERQQSSRQVENKLRSIPRHYDSPVRLHQNGTMPSTGFKIVAYSIIVLLIALLVYIIIAGISIETTI